MKKFTGFAALFMAASMLFGTNIFADEPDQTGEASETTASPFKDVDVTTETGKAILKLYKTGVVAGYEDDTFRPDGNITRAELVRIFNQVFKYDPGEEVLAEVQNFSDNNDPDAWYYNDVRIAQVAGYINGFEDNTFRGRENFTRQQACVVIDLITGVEESDPELEIADEVSEWAEDYVNRALTAGLFELEEGNTFRATQNITRAEVCNLLEIFVADEEESDEETTELTENETQEVTVKTSNGTVVKVTTGGSKGSRSSSRSTTEAATETTTAAATTTEASSETTTTDSGSSAKTTAATTEATTETTTETTTITAAEVDKPSASIVGSLDAVYKALNNSVIPNCSTAAEKDVASQIASALTSYLRDYSFDISSAANNAIDSYRQLSSDEKRELRNLILQYVNLSDLLVLQETYFPGLF